MPLFYTIANLRIGLHECLFRILFDFNFERRKSEKSLLYDLYITHTNLTVYGAGFLILRIFKIP